MDPGFDCERLFVTFVSSDCAGLVLDLVDGIGWSFWIGAGRFGSGTKLNGMRTCCVVVAEELLLTYRPGLLLLVVLLYLLDSQLLYSDRSLRICSDQSR